MEFWGLTQAQWIEIGFSSLIVICSLAVGWLLAYLVLGRFFGKLAKRSKSSLDEELASSLRMPIFWLIVVIGINYALQRLVFIPDAFWNSLEDAVYIVFALLALVFCWRLVGALFQWYSKDIAPRTESNLDEQILPFIRRVTLIVLTLIILIILLDHFNVEVSALVTTLGIGSLAVALAAQETLADTISGFVIMVDRPFRIGDRIEVQDLNTWGDVIDIGLRSTRIRTRDNRLVIVPNSLIGKSLIVNHSYPNTEYRIQVVVGVAYGTELEYARKTIVDAVSQVPGVLVDHPVEALFLEFGESSLNFRVRWWIESYVDTRQMFDKVNTAIYNALAEAGITIPFPQRDVHHKIDPADVDTIRRIVGKEEDGKA